MSPMFRTVATGVLSLLLPIVSAQAAQQANWCGYHPNAKNTAGATNAFYSMQMFYIKDLNTAINKCTGPGLSSLQSQLASWKDICSRAKTPSDIRFCEQAHACLETKVLVTPAQPAPCFTVSNSCQGNVNQIYQGGKCVTRQTSSTPPPNPTPTPVITPTPVTPPPAPPQTPPVTPSLTAAQQQCIANYHQGSKEATIAWLKKDIDRLTLNASLCHPPCQATAIHDALTAENNCLRLLQP